VRKFEGGLLGGGVRGAGELEGVLGVVEVGADVLDGDADEQVVWVPETVHTARDLLPRRGWERGMIRRWRCG
jgi:hypothetical protein